MKRTFSKMFPVVPSSARPLLEAARRGGNLHSIGKHLLQDFIPPFCALWLFQVGCAELCLLPQLATESYFLFVCGKNRPNLCFSFLKGHSLIMVLFCFLEVFVLFVSSSSFRILCQSFVTVTKCLR